MFTHNGKPNKRRVFHPVSKQMQDWTGQDGENCGVFGIWMNDTASFDKMCPGEKFSEKYCCYLDPAVAPLFYMFHYYGDKLASVTKTCKSQAVQSHLQNIGGVYTTSISNAIERSARLSTIKNRLNQILDEFSPGDRSNPLAPKTAQEYLDIMDCSVALYEALQTFTACPAGAAPDSSPFCTASYGMLSPYRSGLYYFLDYTMYEVPFAWWHKCMLLQVSRSVHAHLFCKQGRTL